MTVVVKKILFILIAFSVFSLCYAWEKEKKVIRADSYSSRWTMSTNLVDWGWFFTPNIEAQYSVASHFSVEAQAKFNAWTYNNDSYDKRNRQARQEYSLGARWWPWYVYSGWWVGAKAQYQQYSRRPFDNIYQKEEGDAVGVAFSGGYSLQIKSWFNIDFGLGFWTGGKWYKVYQSTDRACPACGRRIDYNEGSDAPSSAFFFLPNEITIALMFVF